MTINQFIRLDYKECEKVLDEQGVYLDSFYEKENLINVFYLHGFFVEVTMSPNQKEPVDIIPFKHGYNLSNYIQRLYLHAKCSITMAA